MLKKLFGSQIRVDLLRLFIFNPQEEYFSRQAHRLIGSSFESIRKELANLELAGLLKSRISGKQKYYIVNCSHPLFTELKSIILKTAGIGDAIGDAIKDKDKVQLAFIYGSYAKDTENCASDVDVFIIGSISSRDLSAILSDVEKRVLREINCVNFSREEIVEKIKKKNSFIINVLKGPKIFIKGDEDVLRKLG